MKLLHSALQSFEYSVTGNVRTSVVLEKKTAQLKATGTWSGIALTDPYPFLSLIPTAALFHPCQNLAQATNRPSHRIVVSTIVGPDHPVRVYPAAKQVQRDALDRHEPLHGHSHSRRRDRLLRVRDRQLPRADTGFRRGIRVVDPCLRPLCRRAARRCRRRLSNLLVRGGSNSYAASMGSIRTLCGRNRCGATSLAPAQKQSSRTTSKIIGCEEGRRE